MQIYRRLRITSPVIIFFNFYFDSGNIKKQIFFRLEMAYIRHNCLHMFGSCLVHFQKFWWQKQWWGMLKYTPISKSLQFSISINMQFDIPGIERIANFAIYQTNIEVKKQAQLEFENFMLALPLESYPQLFQSFSMDVVLAASATLNNSISKIQDLPACMEALNSIMRIWLKGDGRFVRSNGTQLQDYCTNTIFCFLGKSLKEIYRGDTFDRVVVSWLLMPIQGDKYRLFLFLAFIERISIIESGISFIQYRTLLNSFQSQVIPHILSGLYPYLLSFSQEMQIANLTQLQLNLSIQNIPQPLQHAQNEGMSKFHLCLFKLLNELIQFKYQLNYKQFDQQSQNYQTTSFPEFIINQTIKRDFIPALYILSTRLVQMNDLKYFNICIQCLRKILKAKVNYVKEDFLPKFIGMHTIGLAQLLNNIFERKLNNQQIWMNVLEASDWFMDFYDTCFNPVLNQVSPKVHQAFKIWVQHIVNFLLLIMQSGQPLNINNYLFQTAAHLMGRLGGYVTVKKIPEGAMNTGVQFSKFVTLFFQKFLKNSTIILGETAFKNLQEFKEVAFSFLQKVARTSSACYLQVFTQLNQLLIQYSANIDFNRINITNIILFFTTFIEKEIIIQGNVFYDNVFEKKYVDHKPQGPKFPQELKALQNLFITLFQFIGGYSQSYSSKEINMALILFYDSLFTHMIDSTKTKIEEEEEQLQKTQPIEIKNPIFQLLKEKMNLSEQNFMYDGLSALARLIRHSQITCIEFIFASLYSLISKLKVKFRGEFFKKPQNNNLWNNTYLEMVNLFKSLIHQRLDPHYKNWRILLFKTIALLCFNDTYDQYRLNVRQTLQMIKQTPNNEMDRLLYDLTGIFEGIQSQSMLNYFFSKFSVEIKYDELLQRLYKKVQNKEDYLKKLLHLTYLFIRAKDISQSYQISKITYQHFSVNLPFWCRMLQCYGGAQDEVQMFEEFYLIFKAVIESKNINLAITEQQLSADTAKFLKLVLTHLTYFLDQLENYPQIIPTYSQTIEFILADLTYFILSHKDAVLSQAMITFINKLMQKFINSFESIINGENNPALYDMYISFFKKYFAYLLKTKNFKQNVKFSHYFSILVSPDELKQRFMATLFMLGTHFGGRKDRPTVEQLKTVAHSATSCIDFNVNTMIERIGLKVEADKNQFIRIIDNIKRRLEDWADAQLKDWFLNSLRFAKPFQADKDGGY